MNCNDGINSEYREVLACACVAVCCSVLQSVAACCRVMQCVAECCSVLQCVAVCCSVAECCRVLQRVEVYCNDGTSSKYRDVLACACVAVCYSATCCSVSQCIVTTVFALITEVYLRWHVLQSIAVYCRALQRFTMCRSAL